ncbi:MAG: UDP-N-acetylmuramoyl-tripeptide--D-alanyl-D-alanine ligase [bacterium]
MFYLLIFLWFVRGVKTILFWLYLWQLKEYHIGRFIAHFRTEKGKRLLINKRLALKVFSLLVLGFCWYLFIPFFDSYPFPISFLRIFSNALLNMVALIVLGNLVLYSLEVLKAGKDILHKETKIPVLTKKTIVLILATLFTQVLFTFWILGQDFASAKDLTLTLFYLLIFDILTPLTVSLIVLLFQPLAILGRSRIINRAKKKRAKFKDLLVVGITGSYGKTSTKEILAVILAEKFKVLKTKEHRNSEIGVSQCILEELKPEHEIFICEMAAYNKGGIKLLSDIVKPKIGILTGINQQHLATFGSQENIVKAKFELIESLPEDGTAILNADNEFIRQELETKKFKNQKLYSTKDKLDIWAEEVEVDKESIRFKVCINNDSANFEFSLLGAQNIPNILAAICCAKELGMSLSEIALAGEKIKPLPRSMKLYKAKGNLNVIDATYSANPDGVISHLNYLHAWRGRKVIIMPCLIELGKTAPAVHQQIGAKIAKVCNLAIITTKECYYDIKRAAMKNGMKEESILFLEESPEILRKIKKFVRPGDVVLLESRVPTEVVKSLTED